MHPLRLITDRPLLPLLAAMVLPIAPIGAQAPGDPTGSRNEVTLFAESFAGGVQYLRHLGGPWRLGVQVAAGPTEGVTVSDESAGDPGTAATGYLTVGYRSAGGVEALLSPIGVALATGDDYATAYPSAQFSLGLATGRLRLGTVMRTVRIAGGYGSGRYSTEWIPIRVGITLGR